MARKEKYVTIDVEGRDKGKTFYIKEMPASAAEWWAVRAFQAIARSGVEVPDNVRGAGMAGIALIGLRSFGTLPPDELRSLLDDMFACVRIVRDKNHPEMHFPLIEEDTEEVETRLFLRAEVFELHTGFLTRRREIEPDLDAGDSIGYLDYPNLPRVIGAVIASKLATLHELDTVYSVEDVYLMLEVTMTDAYNNALAARAQRSGKR